MPQLSDLLTSAVTVIIRYNEVKLSITPSTAAEAADALLKKPRAEMIADLTTIISASTASDPTRNPLLTYVLFNIDKLREYKDRESPLEPAELELLKQSWSKLVIDIQTLLKTSQADQVKITYDGKDVMLFGLTQRAWRFWNYCKSGTILAEVLLPALGLSPESTAENISKLFTNMFSDYQKHLSVLAREKAVLELESALTARAEALTRREKELETRAATAALAAKRTLPLPAPGSTLASLLSMHSAFLTTGASTDSTAVGPSIGTEETLRAIGVL